MSKPPFTFADQQPVPSCRNIVLSYLFDLACGTGCLAAAAGVALLCAAVFS